MYRDYKKTLKDKLDESHQWRTQENTINERLVVSCIIFAIFTTLHPNAPQTRPRKRDTSLATTVVMIKLAFSTSRLDLHSTGHSNKRETGYSNEGDS